MLTLLQRSDKTGTNMEVAILENRQTGRGQFNELDLDAGGYPTGNDGTVWATYDLRQAETIRNALVAQHIGCTLKETILRRNTLYLLKVDDAMELAEAMEFIWRSPSGLCLQPDWHYPMGSENKSFNKWINGN